MLGMCFLFFSILNSPQAHCRWATAVANGLILIELVWQATFISLPSQPVDEAQLNRVLSWEGAQDLLICWWALWLSGRECSMYFPNLTLGPLYGPAPWGPAACKTPFGIFWLKDGVWRNRETPTVGECKWSNFVNTSAFCFSVVLQFLFLRDYF